MSGQFAAAPVLGDRRMRLAAQFLSDLPAPVAVLGTVLAVVLGGVEFGSAALDIVGRVEDLRPASFCDNISGGRVVNRTRRQVSPASSSIPS